MAIDRERLRCQLKDLGFDEIRFARASEEIPDGFAEWLDNGYQATMAWLDRGREKRLNPELVLPDVKTVVMLGVNYWPGGGAAGKQRRWAKYSLYADYHDTILPALRAAGRLLEDEAGLGSTDYRYYVDTGPVLERGWAARAGLGWRGKNAMLISRSHGNWLFLAAILVRAEIEPDEPLQNGSGRTGNSGDSGLFCGSCRRCLDACPTAAFPKPGIVDARRCLSFLTIENKGAIPREFRPAIGARIYGCDVCLDVCPWNRFAQAGRQLLLQARYDLVDVSLLDLLRMDVERFREVFRKTAIKRIKFGGILRNACVVAGNLLENRDWWPADQVGLETPWLDDIVAALVRLASSDSALVREHAVWAVYRLRDHEAPQLLRSARETETDPAVLAEYRWWDEQSES